MRSMAAAAATAVTALLALGSAVLAAEPTPPTTPAVPAASTPDRRLAITIDDLPWATIERTSRADLDKYHQRLIAALVAAEAPVTGFVNEGKLVSGDKVETTRVHLLRDWLAAGFELGNHTFSHADLHAVGLERYESEILRGETFLRPLLAEHDAKPRWFRHPYLRAGRSAEEKAALQAFLDKHGYRIAPVTVDNSDWIWAAAYRKALAAGDAAVQARLRAEYPPYMLSKLDYFERQSIQLLGYNPPQILLLHANELNADSYGELVAGIRARGYTLVALEEAMRDPAYARPDGYTGAYGPSWVHRWARAESKPREFYAGEPATAPWVLALAGVESE